MWKQSSRILENVERQATKLVPELKLLSYQERLRELNLPTLYYGRNRYELIQLFKIVSHEENTEVENLAFNDNNTSGHIFKIQDPRCKKSPDNSHSQCIASEIGIGYQTMLWKVIQS